MRFSFTTSLFLSLSAIMVSSCQEKKNAESTETQTTPPEIPTYPVLGNEVLSRLYAETDKVDIIFYNLPISVNQDDAASAKNTALYVSPATPNITKVCQPIGRLTWIAKGAILKEADIYFESGCQYFVFMENNKPIAANAMVQGGIDFFNNILSQVSKPTE
jgi:hypothetical protein